MSNLVSVITPVHAPSLPYLAEAYESLRSQALPAGWGWEWVVQLDGVPTKDADRLGGFAADSRVTVRANHAGGPGVARTTALSRARGTLIRTLDADDRFLPGALARDIKILSLDATLGWVASKALDLLSDGSMTEWEFEDPPNGRLPIGSILDYWTSHEWLFPILPGTVCIRRDLLLALGGWMALPTSEDTGLIIAANAVSDGYFIATPSLAYRKHDAQVTARADHVNPADAQSRRDLIIERATTIRSLAEHPLNYHWWRATKRSDDGYAGSFKFNSS